MKKIFVIIEAFIDPEKETYEDALQNIGLNDIDYDQINTLRVIDEDLNVLFDPTE